MEIKVGAYLRKSSESDDRQALSLPAQEDQINILAKRLGVPIVESFIESKSAKKPGREEFNKLIKAIESKRINSILVWHPNRLSRNAIDAGRLIDLMDRSLLISIVTPTRTYTNSPTDKFFLAFEWGQAKLENDNKSVDVKRGMTTKAKMGWLPNHVPKGYKNTPNKEMGFRTILPDLKRFQYLQSCWYSILHGKRPVEVYEEACRAWKQATGARYELISKSGFYRMLSSTFYYGEFEWPKGSGNWYRGKHKPMVTKEVFDLLQAQLNPSQRVVRSKHNFPYRNLFYCGVCKCMITGTRKFKFNKTLGDTLPYDYYRCSHKSMVLRCVQPPISKIDLNEQLGEVVKSIRIPKDFLVWANKWSKYLEDEVNINNKPTNNLREKEIASLETKLPLLLDKLLSGLITDTEYRQAKSKITSQIDTIK